MKQSFVLSMLSFLLMALLPISDATAQCVSGMQIRFAGDISGEDVCSAPKRIRVIPASNAAVYAFAITDADGNIESVQLKSLIDVSVLSPGSKRIYGISWWGVLHKPVGEPIADAIFSDFCYELSDNFLELNLSGGNLGLLSSDNDRACLIGGQAELKATATNQSAGDGYEILYVLTKGDDLVIQNVNADPVFTVEEAGMFTIHTLIYDPTSLDLSIVEPGITTGFDVNSLLVQGGGSICALLDVAGAKFTVDHPDAGTLTADNPVLCFDAESTILSASIENMPTIPEGYSQLYVLTSGAELVIEQVGAEPAFEVTESGIYTIHTLVYDPSTLDLGIVEPGVTTGVDVNGLLVQGGGSVCASLDVVGAKFDVVNPSAGSLIASSDMVICADMGSVSISADTDEAPVVPEGYSTLYVLTSGDDLVIEAVSETPSFEVAGQGSYTIHTLVYNPVTLDLSIVEPGVTTGFDVNGLLNQGGGSICASLDVAGAKFNIKRPDAGTLSSDQPNVCLDGSNATLQATVVDDPVLPSGYERIFVLTQGVDLVIVGVNEEATFTVSEGGIFTIHTLVYDPATLDLSVVEVGITTGFDVNSLLVQGGGSICASLDVAGTVFNVDAASAGTLTGGESIVCGDAMNTISATHQDMPLLPDGYEAIYVLTNGNSLTIQAVSDQPQFEVEGTGRYTIHTLIYDPLTLDLGIVQPGITTGFDVNNLLVQGGGSICASLDVAGAVFMIGPHAGTLQSASGSCLEAGSATLTAETSEAPIIPDGFSSLYVLTQGEDLVIRQVSDSPEFQVTEEGLYTIHTLIYDPNTLDLSIVVPGQTTGVDVNGLLIQGGGSICASLDVPGASFQVANPVAGTLTSDEAFVCFDGNAAQISATPAGDQIIPVGYEQLFVLTSGDDLTIEQVSDSPIFEVSMTGKYTIHTLIYDPNTLDLSIVVPGTTTGVDVNNLLLQGGGSICAALDVAGAPIKVGPSAGSLTARDSVLSLDGSMVNLIADTEMAPYVPEGYSVLYVLTSGAELIIQNVADVPEFTVTEAGLYTIHTLVYDPLVLDLAIVEIGVTTGADVNGLLVQGGGAVCAALDVAGATFEVLGGSLRTASTTFRLDQMIYRDPTLILWIDSELTRDQLLNIYDQYGRLLGQQQVEMQKGLNQIQVQLSDNNPATMYFIQMGDQVLKVVKSS